MVKVFDPKTQVEINYSKNDRLTDFAKTMLKDFYLRQDEDPQEGFARAARAWSGNDLDLAQRIYNGVSNGYFMYASPVLSNAPLPNEKIKGLPISCFLGYVNDSIQGLIDHTGEARWLSILGGGVGGHWRNVRGVTDKSPGTIPFIHTMDSDMDAYMQGKMRRGSYAAYMDVSHPDIIEFLNLRVPTGDVSRKCHSKGFHNAINITDDFMEAVLANKGWDLVQPHDGKVTETVGARDLWQQILEVRYRTGEPYLCFTDTANRFLPARQKELGLRIHGSNLCCEIYLPTNEERTAVCCLSSLNMETYDEWKGTSLVRDLIFMLNNVLTGFIENAPDAISKAKYSAMRERAVGLGMMGFHSYLQQKGVPFESERAREINKEVFKYVHEETVKATKELGLLYGECPDFQTDLTFVFEDGTNLSLNSSTKLPENSAGLVRAFQFEIGHKINDKIIVDIKGKHPNTGWHNSNLTALAPNASSGILMGTSPSIEPNNSNAYIHETRAGSWPVKNVYLERLLEEKNMNTQEVWNSVITSRGSVQHLDFLTEYEKMVFKTAFELDQHWVVKHAADRGPYVTQGQSVNLFFPARIDKKYFNSVHIAAWKEGLKSLYYTRTVRHNKMDNVGEKIERNALASFEDTNIEDEEGCKACEG